MGKRLLEWWRRLRKWTNEQAKAAAFWLALLALLALLVLLWVAFGSQDDCRCHYVCWLLGVSDKTEAIKLLGFAIAGVMASWGVVAANRRSDALAASAKAMADSAKAANNTANATEAGNRQRAFKDGVEHLGSDKPSVRQGGAHALFHLALEEEKLRASIAGVLCAHIRETTGKKFYQEKNKDKPSAEMQSFLRLLFMTEVMDEESLSRFWQGITPDLRDGYFCGVKLESAQFQGAKLRFAQFKGALLRRAQFEGADLERAQFQGADLQGVQFQGADLDSGRFHGADLHEAQFQGADLERAQFRGARLSGSQFQAASLHMAGFQQAQFGQGPGHEDIPSQGHTAAASDELVEKLKASAFHGVSSERLETSKKFEESINGGIDKEPDFSKVVFAGGVTQEEWAEVKEALELMSWSPDDPGFKEKVIRGLESEIGQPESHTPPKEVIAGSYGKEDAERWTREFREATATAPETNQAAWRRPASP